MKARGGGGILTARLQQGEKWERDSHQTPYVKGFSRGGPIDNTLKQLIFLLISGARYCSRRSTAARW